MSVTFGPVATPTAQAMFVCAAVGDALGWPQEVRGGLIGGKKARDSAEPALKFRSWTRANGFQSARYRDPVAEGEYSDDTQLLLATARACLCGDQWWQRLTEVELPTWPLYQRGGGAAVLRAASSWADGRAPWVGGTVKTDENRKRYFNAGANGVAMRIAPHIVWSDSPGDLVERVVRDGIATHGHPRALVGALAYAFVLQYAATSAHTLEFGELVDAAYRGLVAPAQVLDHLPDDWGDVDAFAKVWDTTNHEMATLLDQIMQSLQQGAMSPPTATLERLGCTDPKIYGAGTITAAGAIYLAARFASRPEGALLASAFLRGGDTDTLASMTAAVLGAVHGVEWLFPISHTVQDFDYLIHVGALTASREVVSLPKPSARSATARSKFKNAVAEASGSTAQLGGLATPDTLMFPDGRAATLHSLTHLDGTKTHRATLRLDDGQTVFVDLTGRLAEKLAALDVPSAERRLQDDADRQPRDASEAKDASTKETVVEATGENRQGSGERQEQNRRSVEQPDVQADVVLSTAQLGRCAQFYAQVLGANLVVRNRSVRIAASLLLQGSESSSVKMQDRDTVDVDTASPESGRAEQQTVEIVLQLDDVRAAAKRMALPDSARRGEQYVLTDPDGRTVRLRSR